MIFPALTNVPKPVLQSRSLQSMSTAARLEHSFFKLNTAWVVLGMWRAQEIPVKGKMFEHIFTSLNIKLSLNWSNSLVAKCKPEQKFFKKFPR